MKTKKSSNKTKQRNVPVLSNYCLRQKDFQHQLQMQSYYYLYKYSVTTYLIMT